MHNRRYKRINLLIIPSPFGIYDLVCAGKDISVTCFVSPCPLYVAIEVAVDNGRATYPAGPPLA